MEDIPDHAITSPFTGDARRIKNHERFLKYQDYIRKWYKDIYALGRCSYRGWKCEICGSRIGSSTSTAILQHLATIKHLKAALGDLEHDSQSNSSGVCDKHTIDSTEAPVSSVIDPVTDCLSE